MSRNTFRTMLALCALALAVSVPAIAFAHNNGGRSHSSHQGNKMVGTIASFTDPTLVITSGGLPVTTTVTSHTRIRWAGRGHHNGWFAKASHDGPNHHFKTAGGLPTEGGIPTQGGVPTEGGVPTAGGLPHEGDHHGHGQSSRATIADLKPGTIVRAANLVLTPDGPVWSDIVLVRPVAVPAA